VPHLRFTGIPLDYLCRVEPAVRDLVCRVRGVPPEIVGIDLLRVDTVSGGRLVDTPPSVEVNWFVRDTGKADALAKGLHDILVEAGIDASIWIRVSEPRLYYEQGVSLVPEASEAAL